MIGITDDTKTFTIALTEGGEIPPTTHDIHIVVPAGSEMYID